MPVQLADLMFGVPVVVVPEVQVAPAVFREPRVFRILDEEPEEAVAVSPPPVAVAPRAPAAMCMASRGWSSGSLDEACDYAQRWANGEL